MVVVVRSRRLYIIGVWGGLGLPKREMPLHWEREPRSGSPGWTAASFGGFLVGIFGWDFWLGFGLGPGLGWPGPSKTNDFERILG